MSDFKILQKAIDKQFKKLAKQDLFTVDLDKDLLWNTYLDSFPPGTNPIFKERREYDCQCCKQFIKACGSIVAIKDNKLISIWDVETNDKTFQPVVEALAELVKSRPINNMFFHSMSEIGQERSRTLLENGETMSWDHFHCELPSKFLVSDYQLGTKLSKIRTNKQVSFRSLSEISTDAIATVLELIEQNTIYRGEEHKDTVKRFLKIKKEFDKTPEEERDNFCWALNSADARVRNTVIGTLLVDISEGIPLDQAVARFETKVAPENYKRTSAVITKKMITAAQKKVAELGIEESLPRRHATVDDISINNVLFADRSVKKQKDVFDELIDTAPTKVKNLNKVEEVTIDKFIKDILPHAESIELMLENKHINNLMSLIAPQNEDCKKIFKWDNNFSWAYNGSVADSMKDRVKKAGGDVDGVLRFSIQWNTEGDNNNDFDAHCIEPNNNHIYFGAPRNNLTTGKLDVDIQYPEKRVAVENITWTNKSRMREGTYKFFVHNYCHRGGRSGFSAEIEYDGKIYSYDYNKNLPSNISVQVALIKFTRAGGIEFIESMPSQESSKEVWNLTTNKFQKVKMIMNSPNHWDEKSQGNKHYFFILEDCKNEDQPRGFFNEFLSENLREHRKVFEVLGSKMKAPESDEQLSGLGFSSTKKSEVLCKVTGNFHRTLKIKF